MQQLIFFLVHARNTGPMEHSKGSRNLCLTPEYYKFCCYLQANNLCHVREMSPPTALLVIKLGNKIEIRMLQEYLLPQPLKH